MASQVVKKALPKVKTPTEWPCDSAELGEAVECPGTDNDNHLCKRFVQIRAGTTAGKPSFGKYFIMHPKEEGGCGYFSYITFKEGENKILLEEPVFCRAKRKIATSEIPSSDIDPTPTKMQKVDETDREILRAHQEIEMLKRTNEAIYAELEVLRNELMELTAKYMPTVPNSPSS